MDVVTGAVNTLLPMLGDLLTREYQLQASVRDDVAFLKAELESMEAALLQISEAPADRPPDAQDSLWAREIRELPTTWRTAWKPSSCACTTTRRRRRPPGTGTSSRA